MPRGVPANGQRRQRTAASPLASAAQEATAQLALSAVDVPSGDGASSEVETYETSEPTPDDLIHDSIAVEADDVEVMPLSPEQERIKQLETQLAQLAGKKDVEPVIEPVSVPGDDGNIVIHFLEDGFSALGNVWYRGQELEFEPGGKAHKDTFDRFGRSWLDLRNNEFAQVERWGKVMFRNGPWPGKRYLDAVKAGFEKLRSEDGTPIAPPTEEELARAEKAEAKRRRSAPHLSAAV